MFNILNLIISFCVSLFFAATGTLLILLPWLPGIRGRIAGFILEADLPLFATGITLLSISIAAIAYILIHMKRRQFHVIKGCYSYAVDPEVFDRYLTHYFSEVFPEEEIPLQLIVKKNQLLIAADLPHIPQHEQKNFLEKMNEEIGALLADNVGYIKPFNLNITFAGPQHDASTS